MTYVKVCVAGYHTGFNFFTYAINDAFNIGQIVEVTFGKKISYGIIYQVTNKPKFKTKEIVNILPITLPQQNLELMKWLQNYYPYDFGEIAQLFIPPNVKVKPRVAKEVTSPTNFKTDTIDFTQDQEQAYKQIQNSQHILLHGDTGTGKTLVFLKEAQNILNKNKSVLILTPEIGLTPQLEESIKNICDAPIFITHSQMTPASRKKVWQSAYNNNTKAVYLGPRSSIFLPFKNLGLVVLDESHDSSFNNSQSPRYHGIHVAAKLANIYKAKFIQSSATPNITDYKHSLEKNVPIMRMKTIPLKNKPLKGSVVDMTDKNNLTNNSLFSKQLIQAVEYNLKNKKQSLLFLNKRGTARIVQCADCGSVKECPHCKLSLTYHHNVHRLICHQCNYKETAQSNCYNCSSTNLLYFSPGTKSVEKDISKMFPEANIARFDIDSNRQEQLAQRLQEIKSGKIDIIIGTQLITKGLDLPNLGFVGILNADTTLQLPDYRAEEIAFQQLYQVSGRVGRGHSANNEFIIQTRMPNHPVIESALQRNWEQFYKYEISKRKQYNYPPYCYIALLKITKKSVKSLQNYSNKALLMLQQQHLTTLGPSPGFYENTKGKLTWQIIVKSKNRSILLNALRNLPSDWVIDTDATSTI